MGERRVRYFAYNYFSEKTFNTEFKKSAWMLV